MRPLGRAGNCGGHGHSSRMLSLWRLVRRRRRWRRWRGGRGGWGRAAAMAIGQSCVCLHRGGRRWSNGRSPGQSIRRRGHKADQRLRLRQRRSLHRGPLKRRRSMRRPLQLGRLSLHLHRRSLHLHLLRRPLHLLHLGWPALQWRRGSLPRWARAGCRGLSGRASSQPSGRQKALLPRLPCCSVWTPTWLRCRQGAGTG